MMKKTSERLMPLSNSRCSPKPGDTNSRSRLRQTQKSTLISRGRRPRLSHGKANASRRLGQIEDKINVFSQYRDLTSHRHIGD